METIVAFLVALGIATVTGQPERTVDTEENRSATQVQADARAERIRLTNAWLRATRQVYADNRAEENPRTILVAGDPKL
jgi:hypothetical protein